MRFRFAPRELFFQGSGQARRQRCTRRTNTAAEREIRTVAMGRKNWTFAGSDEGGQRAAAIIR
jgi:hypothetical protein